MADFFPGLESSEVDQISSKRRQGHISVFITFFSIFLLAFSPYITTISEAAPPPQISISYEPYIIVVSVILIVFLLLAYTALQLYYYTRRRKIGKAS